MQALKREGKSLPPGAAVDADGRPTTNPDEVAALLPFGGHKGYGMSLLNEIIAALVGGSLPTLRGRTLKSPHEKNTYFKMDRPKV